MEKVILVVFISALFVGSSFAQTCKALILSNGGDKGAYQAGAVEGLVAALQAKGQAADYDVIAGVGVGSVNAAFIASYAKGDEANMAKGLGNIWANTIRSKESIYNNWFFGLVEGLTSKNGLYDTTPLKNLITKTFKCQWKRKVTLTVTNADLGDAYAVDLDQIATCAKAQQWILASSALPVFFPYQQIDGYSYVDGAVMQNLDVDSAIRRCKEIVADDSQITVDIIMANNFTLETKDVSQDKPMSMFFRYLEINDYVGLDDDILFAKKDYPNVNFRYMISPSRSLPGPGRIPLEFDHARILDELTLGQADAKNAVNTGMMFDHAYQQAKDRVARLRNPEHPQFAHPQ